jgi:hypothetical protein
MYGGFYHMKLSLVYEGCSKNAVYNEEKGSFFIKGGFFIT